MIRTRKLAGGVAITATTLLALTASASAWSWTNDEAGQKLDQEARHWLSTQNICGVQLKPDYLRDLDARIVAHFTTIADDYRQFLLSSVWTANAEFVSQTTPAEIKNVCGTRVSEAAKAGVLADFNPSPYRWTAITQSSTSGTTPAPVSSPPKPLTLADFAGAWSEVGDACRSYRQQTEGPWFVITEKSFTAEGGGRCRRIKYAISGNMLTITGQCAEEEAGYSDFKASYRLVAGKLKGPYDNEYARCKRQLGSVEKPSQPQLPT